MAELPGNISSGGAALGARSSLEAEYLAAVEPEVDGFLDAVFASAWAGGITLAGTLAMWSSMLEKVAQRLPFGGSLVQMLADHPFASLAFVAATSSLSAAQAEGLGERETRTALRVSLGMVRDPAKALPEKLTKLGLEGAEPGRVVSPEGSQASAAMSEAAARTAATADFGASMIEQMRREGYTHKRWMTRYDSRVRDTHANADRQTVLLDDVFTVGGVTMRYPADPMCADLGEVMNCRCVLVGVRYGQHALDHPPGTAPWNDPRPR